MAKIKNKKSIDENLDSRENKKKQNIKCRNLLEKIKGQINMSDNTRHTIADCGTFLQFITDMNFEKHKLTGANFCENRFCPHCAYNKARKDTVEFCILTKWVKEQNYKFIFLTLTAPNIPADELDQELRDYSNSFKRLFERKEIKKINKGYIRKLELTYNKEREDYHPHYHILIAVKPSYFNDANYYLSRDKWLKMWQEAKRDTTITQVDVRKFKDNSENEKGILEITKYIAKDSNYLISENVFSTFYKSLKGKRMYSFNGLFKTAKQMYKKGELDYLKEKDETEYIYKLFATWNGQKYDTSDYQFLTIDEYNRVNGKNIDELEIE